MHPAALLLLFLLPSSGLKVGFVPLPELGHYNPMRPLAEELARRGHEIEVYAPDDFKPCFEDGKAEGITCVPYPALPLPFNNETIMRAVVMEPFFRTMLSQIEHVMEIHERTLPVVLSLFERDGFIRPDVMITDLAMMSGLSIAHKYSIPRAILFPLSLSLPYWNEPWVPTLGTMFPLNMTVTQRLTNFFLQKLSLIADHPARFDEVRERHGIPPMGGFPEIIFRHTLIAPTLPPLAVAQPLCPNQHAVGFMLPKMDEGDLPAEWQKWLDECPSVVYVNMGSIAVLPEGDEDSPMASLLDKMERGLMSTGMCVLWKLKGRLRKERDPRFFRVERHLPFHPIKILRHPSVQVFVTHCGDTSVMESLSVGVPLVGLPLFVDQGDVCSRVQDAGLGVSLDKFELTAEGLREAIVTVVDNSSYREKAQWISKLSTAMKGPQTAADIVERMVTFGDEHEVCNLFRLPPWQYFQVDIVLVFYATPIIAAWIFLTATLRWLRDLVTGNGIRPNAE